MTILINELMNESGVQFGTSGVRGLVDDMTDQVCFSYVTAFLQYLLDNRLTEKNSKIAIAGDLRSSTPRIMNATAAACENLGFNVVNCGNIPSPAVALFGLESGIAAIMVTGSHIPDDRNGIKFNTPNGEILKADEQGIRNQKISIPKSLFTMQGQLIKNEYLPLVDFTARMNYIKRFTSFFPENCLQSINIGLYEHSSVSRDCFKELFELLGANVTSLGRSDAFISVDTEAIRSEDVELAHQWSDSYGFDCIVSTDGDGDRPLISDEKGKWLRGDVAGILCAQYLSSEIVITPVSSNSSVEKSSFFDEVIRTKIGSPYVIEAMQNATKDTNKTVVGYEANGGFLQQTRIDQEGRCLQALPTRDAAIVPLTIMLLAKKNKLTISELISKLPQRYTYSDRVKNFPTQLSQKIIANFTSGSLGDNLEKIREQFSDCGKPVSIDTIDGLRITFSSQEIVHLRPSGNAPECRCYTEAESESRAKMLNEYGINILNGFR